MTESLNCLKELNPTKVIQSIAYLAEALNLALKVSNSVGEVADIITKYKASTKREEQIAYLKLAIELLEDAEFLSCREFPDAIKKGGDGLLGKRIRRVLTCGNSVMQTVDSYCGALGGDCEKSLFLRIVCSTAFVAKESLAFFESKAAIIENYEQKLLKISFCAAAQDTLVFARTALKALESGPQENVAAHAKLAANQNLDDLLARLQNIKDLSVDGKDVSAAAQDLVEISKAFENLDDLSKKSSIAVRQTGVPIKKPLFYMINYEGQVIRGRSSSNGSYDAVLAPDVIYSVEVYQPDRRLIGKGSGFSGPNGSNFVLAATPLAIDDTLDGDGDGLSDLAEDIVGTSKIFPDTDGDGLLDGVEISQGGNPLDNRAVSTGILATIALDGNALHVTTENSTALVSCGSQGMVLLNVSSPLNPIRTVRVASAGDINSAVIDGRLAATAGTNLSLWDLTSISAPRLVRQVSLGGTPICVTSAGGVAYTGLNNGQIVAVDMAAGVELERLQATNSAIADVVFVGDVLYARTSSRVFAISLATGGMTLGSSVAVNGSAGGGSRLRLNAGEGLIYAPYQQGYTILSLTNPLAPTVQQVISTQQFGWKQMVPTGSGLGVAAMSGFGADADISLYNIGADGKGSQFLTTFVTPGTTEAVSIYNGLAYVADGAAGLTIVNYKAYDSLGVPPTINIKTGFPTVSGALQAEEGKLGRMSAIVADDEQVRNVEFYVDDQLVNTDGNFPFEHRFVTPLRSQSAAAIAAANAAINNLNSPPCCGGQVSSEDVAALVQEAEEAEDMPPKTTFTLRAKATDTGGNSTWSETLTVNLVADATPPRVVKFLPVNGSLTGKLRVLSAVFSEPIDNATLNTTTFAVTGTGPDGLLGTPDDLAPTGGALSYRDGNNSAFLNFSDDLSPGLYRLNVRQPLADLAGNPIAADVFSQVRVFGFADRDGDGVPDDVEALLGLNADNPDTNGNGIPDGQEDFDKDGLINTAEIFIGTDPTDSDSNNNGIPDGQEDADGDKLNNIREFLAGTDPGKADTDGDGWNDETEVTGKSNPLDPNSRPRSFIASVPTTYLLRVGDPIDGLLGRNSVIASPPVQLARLASDPTSTNGGLGSATFISTPPVYLARLGSSPSGSSGAASTIAQPAVFVSRLSTIDGTGNSTSGASIIATPSVTTTRLDPTGAIISKPPVTLQIGTP